MLNKIKKFLGIKTKVNLKLVKYRDPESADYTFFWVNQKEVQVSPNFENENAAIMWLSE